MKLILVRHAESSANAEGRLQGHLDFPLSDRGRRQGACLADRLAGMAIEALYSSPLLRARETAEIIARRLVLPVDEIVDLRERDVGRLAGLTRQQIIDRFPQYVPARAARGPIDISGFEQDEPFAERVAAAFANVLACERSTVAVVTHGGVMGAFVRSALGMPLVRPGALAVDNASITVFDVRDGASSPPRLQLVSFNDTCHLNGFAG